MRLHTQSSTAKRLAILAVTTIAVLTGGCSNPFNDNENSSPLAEIIGADLPATATLAAIANPIEQAQTIEEQISQCMQNLGYEYQTTNSDDETSPTTPDPAAFAATHGFGITTQAFSQTQTGPDLLGYSPSATPPTVDNPNIEHVQSLTPEEQTQYLAALVGAADTPSQQPIEQILNDRSHGTGGCRHQATAQHRTLSEFQRQFGPHLAQIQENVVNDPEWIDYNTTLETCMTNAGQRFLTPETAYNHYAADLAIINSQAADANTPLPDAAKTSLQNLQKHEIQTAKTFHDCQNTPTERTDLHQRLTHKYEKQFIEQNRELLETFTG